jgi:hypothetical protein
MVGRSECDECSVWRCVGRRQATDREIRRTHDIQPEAKFRYEALSKNAARV